MDTPPTAPRPRPLRDIRFRVLIAGRANAGKTTILQRVCDTTESPKIYRITGRKREEITNLEPTQERGQHVVSDELEFSNHMGYVFHDSQGFENGNETELESVHKFISERSQRRRLDERVHVIWCVVQLEVNRTHLSLTISAGGHVPVIAFFTKYEAFLSRLKRDKVFSSDEECTKECQNVLSKQYLEYLGVNVKYVCCQGMQQEGRRCDDLVQMTRESLSPSAVTLMLYAVRMDNMKLNIAEGIHRGDHGVGAISKTAVTVFPVIWVS
ncbi:hypothetical protein B0H13DRAFT_1979484 [Mycena leptocephala]|nr:hypothetical protein B0H13DRAFT_1979484 [Mycena leptocephala]